MNTKSLRMVLLAVSLVVFAIGFQTKYLKTYIGDVQISSNRPDGTTTHRQMTLAEKINLLEQMSQLEASMNLPNAENRIALKRLKTINTLAIVALLVSLLLFLWTLRGILVTGKTKFLPAED